MTPTELLKSTIPINSKTEKISGIYMIYCLPTGMAYIGQSTNINRRWYGHNLLLKNNTHSNKALQDSFNKFGNKSFIFLLLEETKDLLREDYWIDTLDKETIFNKPKGVEKVKKGYSHSQEWKLMMSQRMKGNTYGRFSKGSKKCAKQILRDEEIYKLSKQGVSVKELMVQFNLSLPRVYGIIKKLS